MSKKQILKNIQKEKKSKVKSSQPDDYFKFVTTLAVLLIIFVLAYFLIGLFYTKEINFNNNDEEQEEVTVDNSTIMIGQLLDQSDEEYYVIIYDLSDKVLSISSWLSVYSNSDSALKVYTVDSSKKFNSNYIVNEGSNKQATGLSDLKVISPTLIKVTNGSISEYIEGEEEIVNKLKNK